MAFTRPASSRLRSASICVLDWVTSRYTGSSRWMVVNAVSWPAATSAPAVTLEVPMRPSMGAVTRV